MLAAIGQALADDFSAPLEPSATRDELQPLETAVGILIAELAETKRRIQEQILEIEQKNRLIADRQARELRELSTPVIVIWEGVLAVPLIGTVDAQRGEALIESLLSRVVTDRARHVVVDVTGATTPNASTAQYLLRACRAVRLLGANCLLSGVSPAIAAALVQLGIDLGELRTTPRLGDALKLVFAEMSGQRAGNLSRQGRSS